MTTQVTLYGKPDCTTCDRYRSLLDAVGVTYSFTDISAGSAEDPMQGSIDQPTIVFAPADGDAVELHRPSNDELRRSLERFGLAERTIHHQPAGNGTGTYILPLQGEDAFIDYVDNGDVRHITYSQVPADRRGQGLGAELSRKTLDALIAEGRRATFGCGYVGAVASRYPAWTEFAGSD